MSSSAKSPHEAAYLFFANEPRRESIFVETGGFLGEKTFSYDELKIRFPDMPRILESLAGQKGVIAEVLEKDHGLAMAPGDGSLGEATAPLRLVITFGWLAILGLIAVINRCTGN